jgi:hypothetical protein
MTSPAPALFARVGEQRVDHGERVVAFFKRHLHDPRSPLVHPKVIVGERSGGFLGVAPVARGIPAG